MVFLSNPNCDAPTYICVSVSAGYLLFAAMEIFGKACFIKLPKILHFFLNSWLWNCFIADIGDFDAAAISWK